MESVGPDLRLDGGEGLIEWGVLDGRVVRDGLGNERSPSSSGSRVLASDLDGVPGFGVGIDGLDLNLDVCSGLH